MDMRKFALVPLLLALGACASQSNDDAPKGRVTLDEIREIRSDWAADQRSRASEAIVDGRSNALSRDLRSMWATIDRHMWNYSRTDPRVNFPTDRNYADVIWDETTAGVSANVTPFVPYLGR